MLTLNQVRTQVAAIRKRWGNERAVGLQVSQRWTGPDRFQLDGKEHRIVQADSELALREALVSSEGGTDSLVILSSLPANTLGEDVRARMVQPKNPLVPISSREILRELFKAKEVEPRLSGLRWMADALVEVQPPDGFPPVPGGRLDEETAWEAFLRHVLDIRGAKPDLLELISWSRQPRTAVRLSGLEGDAAAALEQWVARSAGPASLLVFAALRNPQPVSIPALALACDVLFQDVAAPELLAARGRVEQLFGGRSPGGKEGRLLGDAGLQWLIRELEAGSGAEVHVELDQLDQLLRQLRVDPFACLSVASPLGLEQRLERFAETLHGLAGAPTRAAVGILEGQAGAIREHRLAARSPDRWGRVEMALRLARWLATGPGAGRGDFQALALAYQQEGSYVDWARYALYHGDSNERLARAYAELLKPVDGRREAQNREFAVALADWNQAGASGVPGVEDVIPRYVATLAHQARVLMLVIDGMSAAVYRELTAALNQQGFTEAVPPGTNAPEIVVAGLPTVTEWSRRLLLVGRDQAAAAVAEETGFRCHPALAGFSSPKHTPVLFLKASLTEAGGVGLSDAVRREVGGHRPVVGIVLNAVDDHLLKGDQLHVPWTVERIPLLQQILVASAEANRVVVLTSDHGHVIDRDTEVLRHEAGDRYRTDGGPIDPREVEMRGGRVAPFAAGGFIAPWSERVIYTFKKNGYHGGVSPQEVIVPVAVLAQDQALPAGWRSTAQRMPDWWFELAPAAIKRPEPKVAPPPPQPPLVKDLPLFAATAPKPVVDRPWIEALMGGEVFAAQLGMAGRVAPSRDVIRQVLQALDERGGVLLTAALAGKTGVPEFRLPGLLAGLRRVLNVEGYPVLSVDDNAGTVRLNIELLKSQFDLD